jgi:hypothetical protein
LGGWEREGLPFIDFSEVDRAALINIDAIIEVADLVQQVL